MVGVRLGWLLPLWRGSGWAGLRGLQGWSHAGAGYGRRLRECVHHLRIDLYHFLITSLFACFKTALKKTYVQHILLPGCPRPSQISPALPCSLRASFSLLSVSKSCSRSLVSTSATFSCRAGRKVQMGCVRQECCFSVPPSPPW